MSLLPQPFDSSIACQTPKRSPGDLPAFRLVMSPSGNRARNGPVSTADNTMTPVEFPELKMERQFSRCCRLGCHQDHGIFITEGQRYVDGQEEKVPREFGVNVTYPTSAYCHFSCNTCMVFFCLKKKDGKDADRGTKLSYLFVFELNQETTPMRTSFTSTTWDQSLVRHPSGQQPHQHLAKKVFKTPCLETSYHL